MKAAASPPPSSRRHSYRRSHAVAGLNYNHLETHANALWGAINVTNIQGEAGKRVGSFTNMEYVYAHIMWTMCS